MKKILILFGGNSFEYEISCLSVNNIIKNIDSQKINVNIAGITKDNIWYLLDKCTNVDKYWFEEATRIENIISFLKKYDLVFPVMHGSFGEDGRIQSFLELFHINYVGSNSSASKICMDKELTKLVANKYSIKQIPYIALTKSEKDCQINTDFPLIVKPANGGSSIGINIATNKKELKHAINEAFNYDDKIIVERFINARELECAIVEGKSLIVSEIGEIKSCNKFYDYEAKYIKESQTVIPAILNKSITKNIQNLTKKIFKIFNLKDFARIDFLYDEKNNIIYFNEINTIPGFTNISMFPLLFKNKGYNFSDLLNKIINH